MTSTDAYTGAAVGRDRREFGALHEVRGRLELGPPKTPASVRTVHLSPFLADELRAHRDRSPTPGWCSPGPTAGLHRRSNFRRRVWLPALVGDEKKGWSPPNQELHFHDLRHTHETWLVEDHVPRIMRLVRLGHKRKDVDDRYSHITAQVLQDTLEALQQRWEQDGGGPGRNPATEPEAA